MGSAQPAGEIVLGDGDDLAVTIDPDPGCEVEAVLLNGGTAELLERGVLLLENIDWNYTISATFKENSILCRK